MNKLIVTKDTLKIKELTQEEKNIIDHNCLILQEQELISSLIPSKEEMVRAETELQIINISKAIRTKRKFNLKSSFGANLSILFIVWLIIVFNIIFNNIS